MSIELLLQLFALVLAGWFIYIGTRTLLSKKYYTSEIENTSGRTTDEKYNSIPQWRRIYTRFGLGGKWLIAGVIVILLLMYSLFK